MWTPVPAMHLARRLARRPARDLRERAEAIWEISAAERSVERPAIFLPGQLERVTGWAFASEHPRAAMTGGREIIHAATRAYLLRDAMLVDGVLYKDDACWHLQPQVRRLPHVRVEQEYARGAVYCSSSGNKYFGNWLMDDCATYPLAVAEGTPLTTDQPVSVHTPAYEGWLGMKPERVHAAHVRELVIFEDIGQNSSKRRRCRDMGEKLRAHLDRVTPHPGVFVLRGRTGMQRLLRNELELAERLRDRRGFLILDPVKADVPTIVATCAGARAVVGVEGSGLMHGILHLPVGGAVVALQPANRFVRVYKDLTDRDDQHFAFVVAAMEPNGDFTIDGDELERTLDLLPPVAAGA